jgi:predicted amidohydrolase YtcJ
MTEGHGHGHGHDDSPLTRERAGSLGVGAAAAVAAVAFLSQVIIGPLNTGAEEHHRERETRSLPPGVPGDATVIFKNARIIQPGYERATAIAISPGKILAVGTDDEVLGRRSATTTIQDMGGAAIVPGLRDAHAHVFELGAMQRGRLLDLSSLNQSLGEVLLAVGTWKKQHHLAPGEWIVGRGWDHTKWKALVPPTKDEILKAEKEHRDWSKEPNGGMHEVPAGLPDADKLDEAAFVNPVVLYSASGRIAWANHLALDLAKITLETINPPGGRILRDPKGLPNGILLDAAIEQIEAALPAKPEEQAVREAEEDFLAGARACASAGLVEVQVAGVDHIRELALRDLAKKGLLPLRVYGIANAAQAHEPLPEQGLLAIQAVMVAADGGLDTRGARVIKPYEDDAGNTGIDGIGDDDLKALAKRCAATGWQLCIEAHGDAAVNRVLSALEKSQARGRFRIEHADLAGKAEGFLKADVIASMQPSHGDFLARRGEALLGARRGAAEPWKALLEAGVTVAFGSDYPAAYRPLPGLASAVRGGLGAEDALSLYTEGPAFAAFEEERRGRLLPGMDADMTVLSEDPTGVPAENFGALRVLATYLAGREVK